MSNWFNADFALGRDFRGARWLRDALAEEPAGVREVVATYRDSWRGEVKAWELDEAKRRQIVGPGGFGFYVRERTLCFEHCLYFFKGFATDEGRRTQLRRACLAIATLVGSPRAIYTHELLPRGGEDLDEIEAGIRAEFGAPSATFAELAVAHDYEPGCWYIDDFADLR